MGADPPKIDLPSSYPSLPFTEIRFHHVPKSSQTTTPILIIELHRPQRHNAFTPTMMLELERAFTLVSIDPRVKCIVVTGSGRTFCAGADLEIGFKGAEERVNDHRDGGGRVALAIHRCRKPVIAAVNGHAVGVGITMTLPMSIRISYDKAKIGFVFARRGLVMVCQILPVMISLESGLI